MLGASRRRILQQPYQPYRYGDWRGEVRSGWEDVFAGDPFGVLGEFSTSVIRDRISKRVTRIDMGVDHGVIYLTHATSIKDNAGRFHRLLWWAGRSRVFSELRASRALESAGLRVPMVLLVARRRTPRIEEVLVTRDEGMSTLYDRLNAGLGEQANRSLFRMAGRCAADLHRAGFKHGDLLPGNVLVTPDGSDLAYLDNERTLYRGGIPSSSGRNNNLVQMVFRGLLQRPWAEVRAFLDGYGERFGAGEDVWRRRRYRVIRRVRQRLKPWHANEKRLIPPSHRPFGGLGRKRRTLDASSR